MWKRLAKTKGSATLEATIIFPVIMVMLFGIIFFAMYIYQRFVVIDAAVYTAKERAATWDNSKKNLETGSSPEIANSDGLYWRITSDFSGADLVDQKNSQGDSKIKEILLYGVFRNKKPNQTDVNYSNSVLRRTVSVGARQNVVLPDWIAGSTGGLEISGEAAADVAEPVELIRNFNLGPQVIGEIISSLKTMGQGSGVQGKQNPVVSSVMSDVNGQKLYHYSGCKHISKIKQKNFKGFNSVDEARKGGFSICLDCAKTITGYSVRK
jgi:Flp pilus assembly protein TadG